MAYELAPLFQSTRPHGARHQRKKDLFVRRCFNPRARMGRDSNSALTFAKASCFNPRARMGRDPLREVLPTSLPSFNPRARMGRDLARLAGRGDRSGVSIHAPAWGATLCQKHYSLSKKSKVSIHAPAWGATYNRFVANLPEPVSIHAPAWGATQPAEGGVVESGGFNPRARMGRDPENQDKGLVNQFQSTRPHGARPPSERFCQPL